MELKTYFAQDRNGSLIPSATVAVYLTGTNTLASGLTTVSGTTLANPFTADADGKIQFRAPDGIYDMQVSQGSTTGVRVTFQCVDVEQQLSDANSAADRAELAAEAAEQANVSTVKGYNFTDGATLNSVKDFIYDPSGKRWLFWSGTFPAGGKVVPSGSTPENTGGIADGAWKEISYDKDDLGYVTPEMFGAVGGNPAIDDYEALQAAIDTRKPVLLSKNIYHTSLPLRVYTGTVIIGAGTSKSVIRKVGTAGLTDQPAITDPWGTSRTYNGIDAIIIALPNAADIDTDGGLTGGITRVVTGLSFSDFAVDRHAPRSDRWDPATGLRHYLNRSYVQTTSSGYAFLTYAMAESAFKNIYLTCCEDGFWSNNSWVLNLTDVRSECRAPFTINAGTSVSMNSCYAINANPRTAGRNYYGYDLSCNYSALNACAADGSGRDGFPAQAVYYIGGQVTLNGCGCEVTHAIRVIDIKGYSSVNFNNFNVHVFNNKYNTDGSSSRGWIRVGEAAKLNINGLYSSNFLQSDSVNPATGLKPVFAEVGTAALFNLEGAFSVGTNNRITGVNDNSYNQVYLGSGSSSFRFKGLGTELDYSVVNGEDAYTGPHTNQNYTRNPIVIAHDVTAGAQAILALGSRLVTSAPQVVFRAAGTAFHDGSIVVTNPTTPAANFSGSVMSYSAGAHSFSGTLRPSSDNAYNLGSGTNRWAAVFSANGTIQTCDERYKTISTYGVPDALLDAWDSVNVAMYKMNDSIELKGYASARWHMGLIAQTVIDAMTTAGLNWQEYGLVAYESWSAQEAIWQENEEGELVLIQDAIEAGDMYCLRPDECMAVEIAWQRRKLKQLEDQIQSMIQAK